MCQRGSLDVGFVSCHPSVKHGCFGANNFNVGPLEVGIGPASARRCLPGTGIRSGVKRKKLFGDSCRMNSRAQRIDGKNLTAGGLGGHPSDGPKVLVPVVQMSFKQIISRSCVLNCSLDCLVLPACLNVLLIVNCMFFIASIAPTSLARLLTAPPPRSVPCLITICACSSSPALVYLCCASTPVLRQILSCPAVHDHV